ncbi:hypothetical protein GN958_ATG23458 [Phytophthora infestans]|uniref:Uncharacterized protein n=1 Tax=Phytophthora infestans TaxID=4787 RepID=A0A8S9TKQ4_PHYIN|nr:hypothetical protein GN958_ATG23458 [Phytophthora infestans]
MEGDAICGVLAKFGLIADDFGSHSARKEAATYASSCSTSDLLLQQSVFEQEGH